MIAILADIPGARAPAFRNKDNGMVTTADLLTDGTGPKIGDVLLKKLAILLYIDHFPPQLCADCLQVPPTGTSMLAKC